MTARKKRARAKLIHALNNVDKLHNFRWVRLVIINGNEFSVCSHGVLALITYTVAVAIVIG